MINGYDIVVGILLEDVEAMYLEKEAINIEIGMIRSYSEYKGAELVL